MDSFIGTSKSLQTVYRKQLSQPEYVIIFHIAKSYTMSEILGRKTPMAVALEYTVLSPHPQSSQYNRKNLSINFHKLGSLDTGQFTIFIIVGRWNEGGVIQMPAKLSLICTLSSSLTVFRNGNNVCNSFQYFFLKMEIYNSLQGNIFHIKDFIFHIKKTYDCSQRKKENYSSLQTNIDI